MLLAKWSKSNRCFRAKAMRHLSPIYQAVSNRYMIKNYGSRFIKFKVVKFKRDNDNDIFLLLGDKVIGRYNAKKDAWDINYVYRLFINEAMFQDEDKNE